MQNTTTPNHNKNLNLVHPVILSKTLYSSPPFAELPSPPQADSRFKFSAPSETSVSSVAIRIRHSDFVIDSEFWLRNSSFTHLLYLAYLNFFAMSKHVKNMSKVVHFLSKHDHFLTEIFKNIQKYSLF